MAIFEVEDTAVFEVAAEDAAHMNVVANTLDLWHQITNSAHDEVDRDSGLRGFVEVVDRLLVDEAVDLSDDSRWPTRACIEGLCINVFLGFRVQGERGYM